MAIGPAEVHRQKVQMRVLFDEVAAVYDRARFFSLLGRSLVAWSGLPSSGRVMDLAAGRGAILEHLLTPDGSRSLVAVDLSAQMMVELRRSVGSAGHRVTFAVMDAERLSFADCSFDAVMCGFALNMFPDAPAALREIHRILRPGALLAFSLPGPALSNPFPLYSAVIARCGPAVDPSLWTISELRHPEQKLTDAGFVDIEQIHDEVAIPLTSVEAFWEMEMAHGLRGFYRALPPPVAAEFRRDVDDAVNAAIRSGMSLVGRGAYFLRARRAGA